MKIIKPGVPPEDWLYEHTCTSCKCEFEFKGVEAISSVTGVCLLIRCPTCSQLCRILVGDHL